MAQRQVMFEQDSKNLNFGKGKYWRTNTYDAQCTGLFVVENVISIEYAIYTFRAGAAHGYTGHKTYVFIIYPTVHIENVEDIFTDKEKALGVIQASTRSQLLGVDFGSDGKEPIRLEEHWVIEGTLKWENFSAFSFTQDGLAVTFSPYQVAAYAFGPQRATVKWREIRPFVREHILCALGREFEHFDEKDDAEKKEISQSIWVKADDSTAEGTAAEKPSR
jgi:hypothetical protein